MRKINVLFIAYQFPPLMVGGSFRPYRFVKYFSENDIGINPFVARLSPKSYENVYESTNQSTDFTVNAPIYEIHSAPVSKKGKIANFISIYFNLFKGNESKGVESHFKKQLFEIIEKESIDLVWVTCPPFSIGDMVRRLLKGTKTPYIADMRDAWALWISQPYGTRIHYYYTKRLERKLLSEAAAVVGVTKEQIKDFSENQNIPSEKFSFIPNSIDFDIDDIQDITIRKKKMSLTIGYVGSFYFNPKTHKLLHTKWYKRSKHRKFYYWPRKEEWIYRSPYFFFKAVKEVLNKNPEIEINIKFAGTKPDWLEDMVADFGLENVVQYYGYISGKNLDNFYSSCDTLLLTSLKVENGKDYCLASKSFDYIRAKKPVLAFLKEGAQKEFLEKSQNAYIVDADDLDQGINTLKELAQKDELEIHYNKAYLKNYTIKETAIKLKDLIKQIVVRGKGNSHKA